MGEVAVSPNTDGQESAPGLSNSEQFSVVASDSALPDATAIVQAGLSHLAPDADDQASDPVDVPPIVALASQINARFDELSQWLNESNRIAAERERIIDRLHLENQQLKSGELQQAMLPVFRDLIRLHDDLRQTAQHYAGQDNEEAARDFLAYGEAAADILYRYGVERYEAALGEPFNPKEQRALAAVPTTDDALDRTIAKIIRSGFRTESRTIRLLEAEVYRATPRQFVQPALPDQTSENRLPATDTQ